MLSTFDYSCYQKIERDSVIGYEKIYCIYKWTKFHTFSRVVVSHCPLMRTNISRQHWERNKIRAVLEEIKKRYFVVTFGCYFG